MDTRQVSSQLHRMITEPLTWAEIWEHFPQLYLVLVEVDPVQPGSHEFHSARVIGAGRTVTEACAQAALWRLPFDATCLFSTQHAPAEAFLSELVVQGSRPRALVH